MQTVHQNMMHRELKMNIKQLKLSYLYITRCQVLRSIDDKMLAPQMGRTLSFSPLCILLIDISYRRFQIQSNHISQKLPNNCKKTPVLSGALKKSKEKNL